MFKGFILVTYHAASSLAEVFDIEPVSAYLVVLRYCRNVRPTWVKFNSKDTKESERFSRF